MLCSLTGHNWTVVENSRVECLHCMTNPLDSEKAKQPCPDAPQDKQ